jgi:hypothetical protein
MLSRALTAAYLGASMQPGRAGTSCEAFAGLMERTRPWDESSAQSTGKDGGCILVFVVLFFIPVLLVLLIAMLIPEPPKAKEFKKDELIRFTHWPGRTAKVKEWYNPNAAKARFPHGVRGASKPPYLDGVVEAEFLDFDPQTGKPYPIEIASGTYAEKVK